MSPEHRGNESVRQVDVLSGAVQISVDASGLQEFTPHFLYAALNRGVFCFGAMYPAQRRNRFHWLF
jgi:hypothetical protein